MNLLPHALIHTVGTLTKWILVPDVHVTEQGPFLTCNLADKQGPSQTLGFGRDTLVVGLFRPMVEPTSTGGGSWHLFFPLPQPTGPHLAGDQSTITHRIVTLPRAQKIPPWALQKLDPKQSRQLIATYHSTSSLTTPRLLLRSSCGCSRARLASHEQCTALLSSLLLTEKARIQSWVQFWDSSGCGFGLFL